MGTDLLAHWSTVAARSMPVGAAKHPTRGTELLAARRTVAAL